MREIVETFTIDEAMVERFAALTGDRNALHTNAAFARRSRYRQRVAHGMLALGQIARLQLHFPTTTLRFRSIQGRFEAPIPLGAALKLETMLPPPASGLQPFEASWINTTDGRTVITATGSLALTAPPIIATADASGAACLLVEPEAELIRGPEDLVDVTERLAFNTTSTATVGLAALMGMGQGSHLCPNLAAILLLSTLVGMRLPGRRATFTSFAMTFARDLEPAVPAVLEGTVTKVSAASETLMAETRVEVGGTTLASGEIRALVNPPPRAMLTAEAIRNEHLALGLAGKTVVVIGASRGIGETAAKLFAMHGAMVVVHYFRGEQDAAAIVTEIEEAGGRALALGCDIRDDDAVAGFFDAIVRTSGGVDVLVNNAVMDFRPEPITALGWADFEAELEVSLKGLHACCSAAIPHMKTQGGGRIINVSSIATTQPVKGQARYITAKSAVEGYTKSLAIEHAKDNIQANLVVPAMTETDLLASIPSDFIRRMGTARAMRRNLQPIEVAQAMVYLASDWARGMSGQRLVLNLGEAPFA